MDDRDALARDYHRSLALRWIATVLPMPALVPLLLARGLGVAEVGLVLGTYAAVTAALEVPTGGLADAVGRVRIALVADALAILGRLGLLLAPSVAAFLVAAAVAGAARALGSGALEAWYVDARRRREAGSDLRVPLARAGVIEAVALGLGTLAGGALPLLAPVLGIGPAGGVAALQLAFGASIAIGVLALAATAALREADAGPLAGRAAARPDRVLVDAWRALRGDRSLAALIGLGAAAGATVMGFEAYFPVELSARWGDGAITPLLGVALAGAFAATALGQGLAGRSDAPRSMAPRGRGPARAPGATAADPLRLATVGHLAMALGALALVLGPWTEAGPLVGAGLPLVALWLAYFGLGLAAPSVAAAFHDRAPAARRAALLSVRSLVAYGAGVAATVAFGALAAGHGLALVWTALAVVGVAGAIGLRLWGRKRALTTTPPDAAPARRRPAPPPAAGRRSSPPAPARSR